MNDHSIIVMGVSGCGKSLIGQQLAQKLGLPFFDADDFHSDANVSKMASGVPLTDADRADWLASLAQLLRTRAPLVLACSALRQRYRDELRRADPALVFVHLDGEIDTIWARLSQRRDHYFSGRDMLESQFAQLERPGLGEAFRIDIDRPAEAVLAACLDAIGRGIA
ncbi:gluconate kinase [Saccharospirillum sp. MSK14-1]|uniref:gluconokinase n=1 Tax=Saccharospirillum sp. MSK14-1 TaxID=1897632 RepID=UPI000D3C216D|nr:gluconokinase [Saccharospirillum sp. MSK14-1]PTY37506.1 gluconate kinase [Saccharospirillum sp. MSK14-1]